MRFPYPQVTSFEDATRNFEQITQQDIHTGTGAPAFEANRGAFYLRKDTPATVNQRIYVNTSAAPSGATWTALI